MTPRSSLPRLVLLLLMLGFLATSGCSRFKDKDALEGQPVEELYGKAHAEMRKENWDSAIQTFKRLVAQYPYGPYTEQALVETAYANYKAGNNEEAISSIDRFLRTYPTHRDTAYMYYLRGLVNSGRDAVFLQKVWSLDASRRDLATPMQGYNDFETVTTRYPNSRYAEDARLRMLDLRNMFARHEMDVGLYYMRRNANVAALDRAKYLLETYPQSQYQSDAVALMAAAYTRLGNDALAADAKRVLEQNDPQHPYLSGTWPKYSWTARRLNPFAGEKSALDNEPKR